MVEPSALQLLFLRPKEGLFTKRENKVFDLSEEFLTPRYKPIGAELQTRFGEDVEQRIPLRSITPPDIAFTDPIKKDGSFSLFNQTHREIAGQLVSVLLNTPDISTFLSTAAYIRDRLNPYLYQYALAVAMSHREDTQNIPIPSIANVFPDQFVDSAVFPKAREEQALAENTRMTVDIPMNFTASEREEEQRLAYFREDIGVNLHHWHWHLVYPGEGEDRVVNKDRRGELFYYMHSQLMSRYDCDRYSSRLKRVKPLTDLRKEIPEGYFPKIIRSTNNRAYPPRTANSKLLDIDRPDDGAVVQVADLERWRDRIFTAIDQGYVVDLDGNQIPLDVARGIDILGNIIEACKLSPNRKLYGNLHNQGHNVISYIHDPENRYLEEYGVMGDVTTAMRDPIFYRWHKFIDNCFIKYKETLPAYTTSELGYDGVVVDSVKVQISRGRNPAPNVLLTYWQRSDVNLGAGLDFGDQGNVFAQFTHLQHAPFDYIISVTNSGAQRRGTCRIFFCPKFDERGMEIQFRDKRTLAIEMDKFSVTLNPGENTIRRRSDESNVTIPYERSFRNIGSMARPAGIERLEEFQFCGCGWPDHMLVPKGTAEGAVYQIFAMVSNFDDDVVNQTNSNANSRCDDAASFCGLRDRLYPDRRAMGFPFDRIADTAQVRTLENFVAQTTNMNIGECTIRFSNAVIDREP